MRQSLAPNRNNKRGARRVRQNKPSGTITLRGRQRLFTVTPTSHVVNLVTTLLHPFTIGDRPGIVAPAFLRYRFKSLVARYRSGSTSAQDGNLVMGFADDSDNTSVLISTPDQILNLRKSQEFNVWKNANLRWSPVDREKWYYVNQEATNNDQRFTTPAALLLMSDLPSTAEVDTAFGVVDLDYVIEFTGNTLAAV